jgi:hypothetical protein
MKEETKTQSEQQASDKEPELFSSMNQISEGESDWFKKGLIALLILLALFAGQMLAKYLMKH